MGAVTEEMIYHLALRVRDDLGDAAMRLCEIKSEMQGLRGHMSAVRQDIHNIHAILIRRDARLDRIERRLELTGPAGL